MVEVSYYCPYCGAVTSVERDAAMRDESVTPHPREGYEYASTTEDVEAADGIEFVCLGNVGEDGDGDSGTDGPATRRASEGSSPGPALGSSTGPAEGPQLDADGCGRTFYLHYRQTPPSPFGSE